MKIHRAAVLAGQDAYELLGVDSSASEAEIRRGYLRVMRLAHPDRNGREDQAKLINCARDVLLHDRVNYDEYRQRLAQRLAAAEPGHDDGDPVNGEGRPGPSTGWVEDDWPESEPEPESDPWDDSDEGVGEPGTGADAPGAADDLGSRFPVDDDDRPYRPFRPGAAAERPAVVQLLHSPPILLAVALLVGVLVAVLIGRNAGPAPSFLSAQPVQTLAPYQPLPQPSYPASVNLFPSYSLPSLPVPSLPAASLSGLSSILRKPVGGSTAGNCTLRADSRIHCSEGIRIGSQKWRSLTEGSYHGCAIRFDRTLWCWGDNSAGQLGTTQWKWSHHPVPVHNGGQWLSVAARFELTCAVRVDHTLWCWGKRTSSSATSGPAGGQVPHRFGRGNTWRLVTATAQALCAERPGASRQCWEA